MRVYTTNRELWNRYQQRCQIIDSFLGDINAQRIQEWDKQYSERVKTILSYLQKFEKEFFETEIVGAKERIKLSPDNKTPLIKEGMIMKDFEDKVQAYLNLPMGEHNIPAPMEIVKPKIEIISK